MNYYDYIAHYGVQGMKKGKRRWTNADGTLNEAGKRRYGTGHVVLGTGGATATPGRDDGGISKRVFTYRDKNGELLGTTFSRNELTDRDHAKNIRNLRALNTTPEQRKANIEKARSNQGGKQYKVSKTPTPKEKLDKINSVGIGPIGYANLTAMKPRQTIQSTVRSMKKMKRGSTKKKGKSFVSKFLDRFK